MSERRTAIRYPVWYAGTVRWAGDHPQEQAATVVDLSAAGAAIETSGEPGQGQPVLELVLAGSPVALPFEVDEVEQHWYGTTLHVEFVGIGANERAALDAAIDHLDSGQRAEVERLAARGTG